MRKLRSDALWHKLTPDQKNQVQHWLFVEHLGYAQTHDRIQKELGIACALSTIGPMFHYLQEMRSHEREAILQKLTDVITEPGADLERVRIDLARGHHEAIAEPILGAGQYEGNRGAGPVDGAERSAGDCA